MYYDYDYYRQQPGQFVPGFPPGGQQNVNRRLDRVERRLDRLEEQFQRLDRRVDRIERRLGIRVE